MVMEVYVQRGDIHGGKDSVSGDAADIAEFLNLYFPQRDWLLSPDLKKNFMKVKSSPIH